VKPVSLPPIPKTDQLPPVLIIGNFFDPITPYVQSEDLAQRLTNSRLLTWEGIGHTIIFSTQDDCIINPIVNYLLYLELPPKNTTCPSEQDPFPEMAYRH